VLLRDAMDLPQRCMIQSEVEQRHWRQEGKDPGRCRCGCRAFLAREVPRRLTEREADVPLEDGRDA
jgi:hypothetical protein